MGSPSKKVVVVIKNVVASWLKPTALGMLTRRSSRVRIPDLEIKPEFAKAFSPDTRKGSVEEESVSARHKERGTRDLGRKWNKWTIAKQMGLGKGQGDNSDAA